MIERDVWGRIIRDFQEWDVDLIRRDINYEIPKVRRALTIIGPRRSGKTFFMFQIVKDLLESVDKRRIIFIDFEDPRLIDADLNDLMTFLEVFYTIYPENTDETCYFFLDEVQCVVGWEKFVRFLLDRDQKVVISGSSSKLLSKEIATSLRGRSVSIRVHPFSFREILKAREVGWSEYPSTSELARIKSMAEFYLFWGGYPEVVLNPTLRREILREILDLTIYKDVVDRWNVENVKALKLILKTIAHSTHLSISKVHKNLKGLRISMGKNTVANYLEYLEDSLTFYRLPALAKSYKRSELLGFKPYLIDNGLLWIMGVEDRGRLFENLVFVELLKAGCTPGEDLFYGKFNDFEVDFIANCLPVQVCYDIHDPNTRERELRALMKACDELDVRKGSIVTWDHEERVNVNGISIEMVPAWKFFLQFGENDFIA